MANKFNFRESAIKELSLSPLMQGRTKAESDEIAERDLTLIAFDFIEMDGAAFPVMIFEELPDKFYFGGKVLMKLMQVWVQEFNGDPEEASVALAEEGGFKMRLKKSKTKKGNDVYVPEVL